MSGFASDKHHQCKKVVLLNIFVETVTHFFHNSLKNSIYLKF